MAAFGEYLVWRKFEGTRNPQASGQGDVNPARGRRIIEVKTTSGRSNGWNLNYRPTRLDYALLRIDTSDWSVVEAWFVPLPVARLHAKGGRHRLSTAGKWQGDRRTRRLSLRRF